MNARLITAVLLTLSCSALPACTSDPEPEPSEPEPEPEVTPDPDPSSHKLEVLIYAYPGNEPLADIGVCADSGMMSCVTTDEDGIARVTVWDGDGTVTLAYSGIVDDAALEKHAFAFRRDAEPAKLVLPAFSAAAASGAFTVADIERDPSKGIIIATAATAEGAGVAGATALLAPATGETFFIGETGLPDTNLESTTSHGGLALVNVEPGEVEFTVAHSSMSCANAYAPIGANDAAQVLETYANVITIASITHCE